MPSRYQIQVSEKEILASLKTRVPDAKELQIFLVAIPDKMKIAGMNMSGDLRLDLRMIDGTQYYFYLQKVKILFTTAPAIVRDALEATFTALFPEKHCNSC